MEKRWITTRVATFHSCFVWLATSEFGSFMEWHVLNSSIPNAFQMQYVGDSTCLTVSLRWTQLSASLIIKSLFELLLAHIFKWCLHPVPQCPTGWTIQHVATFGMLPKIEHAWSISSASSTPPLLVLKSSRDWKDTSLLLCLPLFCWKFILYFKTPQRKHRPKNASNTFFWERSRHSHVVELQWSWLPKNGHRFMASHLLKHVCNIQSIFLLLACPFCSQK